jgi:phosphate/sulfate permease
MVYLLPVEMVAGIGTTSEVAFLLAMVVTAVLWNLSTWFLGIPNSTTHTYVGAILGVTAAHAFVHGQSISAHMHWHEGEKVIAAHGTATQLTAIACIALADGSAVPVSTTHVVTSGVAGSMRASGAGLQLSTIRGILITWFTTMPGCFALSFAFSIVLHAAFA